MQVWSIKRNIQTRIHTLFLKKFPFKYLKFNKRIIESLAFEDANGISTRIPPEDNLRLRLLSVSQIIPIEKLNDFVNNLDSFISRRCERQFIIDDRDKTTHFSNMAIWNGDYANFGFGTFLKNKLFDGFSCYAYRVAESFIQITFIFELSDDMRYEFYKILRYPYKSCLYLINIKHPTPFHKHSFQIYNPSHVFSDAIFMYFKCLRKMTLSLLHENRLILHISRDNSIEFTNILSFKKVRKDPEKTWGSFWELFGLMDDITFTDDKNILFFPDFLNFDTDLSMIGHYFFVSEDTFEVSQYYKNIEHELTSLLREWGTGLIKNLVVNNIINDYYANIKQFRMNYFDSSKAKKIARKFDKFQRTNYWVGLISSEYILNRTENIFMNNPVLTRKYFKEKQVLVDTIAEDNDRKIKHLKSLSSFIEDKLRDYNKAYMVNMNNRTQFLVILLTIVTIIIGVIQIIGKEDFFQ